MSITIEFNALWNEKEQRQRVIDARARLQNCYWIMQETDAIVQKLKDAGELDTIPTDTKAALNNIWTILKQALAALQSPTNQEVLNWKQP